MALFADPVTPPGSFAKACLEPAAASHLAWVVRRSRFGCKIGFEITICRRETEMHVDAGINQPVHFSLAVKQNLSLSLFISGILVFLISIQRGGTWHLRKSADVNS